MFTIAALIFPLLLASLLVFNTANSGNLSGGFSRRILRLPTDTWSTVLVVLMTPPHADAVREQLHYGRCLVSVPYRNGGRIISSWQAYTCSFNCWIGPAV